MTPLQVARAECANFDPTTSGCKGIGIKDDGSLFMFGAKPACVLGNRQPCAYFEELILPMGIECCNARNVQRAKDRDEARDLYARFAPAFSKAEGRVCPACNERLLEPHKRLCYLCAAFRKQEAWRKSKKASRHVHNPAS